MIGDIYKNTPVSAYQPPDPVRDFTKHVQDDYTWGNDILNRSWNELNGRSVLQDDQQGKMMFNAFVDESIDDPATAWQYRGTRSKARNKGITMHAQLTAAYMVPMFSAQNENDELDRDYSNVMRDIVEWMITEPNSDYRSSFMSLVIGMIESPVVYLGAEYKEVFQKIKEKSAKGYTSKEIIDEVLSGFKAPVYGPSEVLRMNAYERNMQRQRSVIKRRWVEYSEALANYGEHENWDYVQRGVNSIFNAADGLFYEVKDDDHPNLVLETTYLNRREDTEVCFLGGVYMGDTDVEANPMRHRDNRNTPKYNLTAFGYHHIGEHFNFYKSMMNALKWDNSLYDAMTEITMNRAMLELNMPIAISGTDKIDSDVVFPGAVTTFKDKDTKATPLLPPANFAASFQSLKDTDDSMSEGSLSDVQGGQLPQASQKAYNVARAEQNAKKLIGGVGKALAESVAAYGSLMADIALQHLTVPQVDEILGGGTKTKYRKFLLENKMVGGKRMNKLVRFDETLVGTHQTKEQNEERSLALLKEVGYPDNKEHIYVANPYLFSKMKYLCRVDPEEMFPKNDEMQQALITNLFQILRDDPYIEQEALRRKLLYSYYRNEADELMTKNPQNAMALAGGQPPMAGGAPLGQMAQNKALSTSMAGESVL